MDSLKKTWVFFGNYEPYWSVMSSEEYQNKNIESNFKKFYDSSQSLITLMKDFLKSNNIEFKFKKIVDFGCGVGRITNLLSEFGENIYGIDISESHLKIARDNIKKDNIQFIGYDDNNNFPIELYNSNLVISFIVLQHNRPAEMKYFIEKILNILDKDGIALLHIPYIIDNYDKSILDSEMTNIEVHYLEYETVLEIIENNNCYLKDKMVMQGISHSSYEYLYLIIKK